MQYRFNLCEIFGFCFAHGARVFDFDWYREHDRDAAGVSAQAGAHEQLLGTCAGREPGDITPMLA